MFLCLIFVLLLFFVFGLVFVVDSYCLDLVYIWVLFVIEYVGFLYVLGIIFGSEGVFVFDLQDWVGVMFNVSVLLQCLDLGDDKWNKVMLVCSLFDVECFFEVCFVFMWVELIDVIYVNVIGQLILYGVSCEVMLVVMFNVFKCYLLLLFWCIVGFLVIVMFSCSVFGVDGWLLMIGDEVQLCIEVEVVCDYIVVDLQDILFVEDVGILLIILYFDFLFFQLVQEIML